jgi:CheY-like chemotaxis protein
MANVVIVEDSGYMRSMISTIVARAGHDVVATGADGVQGRAVVLEHEPDCVLSDLLMPNCDGIQMIEDLRDDGWDGPVIVITADVQKSTRRKCEEMGVVHFLHKPPDHQDLEKAINSATAVAAET